MSPDQDSVAGLLQFVDWTQTPNESYLFSGSRGSGKTIELNRLIAELRDRNIAAYYCDASVYLNLDDPKLSLAELLMTALAGLSDALRKKLLRDWPKGFVFFLIFGDDYRVPLHVPERLVDYAASRTWIARWVRPEQPDAAVDEALDAAFRALPTVEESRVHPQLLSLELTVAPGNDAWVAPRLRVLAARNRRRSSFELPLSGALFVTLLRSMTPAENSGNNEVKLRVWARMLRQMAAHVPLPTGPPRAIEIASVQQEHFDGLLMSLEMPELDGQEAMRQLPASRTNVPALALTAHASVQTLITTPVNRVTLLAPSRGLQAGLANA